MIYFPKKNRDDPSLCLYFFKREDRLIELGGLVSKAQLEDWIANTLLGAFLFLKEQESDATQLEEWAQRRGVVFNERESSHRLGYIPTRISFYEFIDRFRMF